MSRTTSLLDDFYAGSLGCSPEDLNSGRVTIVGSDMRLVTYAKGRPLALYAIVRPGGSVIAVRPEYEATVKDVVGVSNVLTDEVCDDIEHVVSPLVGAGSWFRGIRLFCEPNSFVDCTNGEAREILPGEDERAGMLHRECGGPVFGQLVGGRTVSWAAVKPLSDVIWDLSVETLLGEWGRGYARSAVSAALRHVFASGRVAGWGCDRINAASLCVARSVGYQYYALDFGCIERGTVARSR